MVQAEKERIAKIGKVFNVKKYIKNEIEAIRSQVGPAALTVPYAQFCCRRLSASSLLVFLSIMAA